MNHESTSCPEYADYVCLCSIVVMVKRSNYSDTKSTYSSQTFD